MRALTLFIAIGLCWCLFIGSASYAFGEPADAGSDTRPYGIERRTPWTTSRVKGSPDPQAPYRTQLAFPKLKFNEPLALVSAPGTERLFVAERYGKIFSFPVDSRTDTADLFLDVGHTVYALAFHPNYADNGYFYVLYVLDETKLSDTSQGSRLVRYRRRIDDPLRADPESETLLLTWPVGGHNGGGLAFGPDGYLYVGTGDGSGIADELETGQNISDLLGSILRIDVDRPSEGLAYGIPPDNPFVGVERARPEIWAYGLRQPWRMNFDPRTGDLWAGNVGQDLWEQVYRIERGGNYGWSVTEGIHPFRPQRPQGPTPILPPIVEHDHAIFRSVTGGYVYRGSRLRELVGVYIYGDYDTGKVWGLRYRDGQLVEDVELVDTNLRIVSFGEDNAGELYLVDHMGGRIHQLVPAPSADSSATFPRKLSETGLFSSVKNHVPQPGLIPYSVASPMWSDGASKERFLALPGDSRIELDAIDYPQPAPGALPGWKFPDGTVLVETISLETETGNPSSRRRLETRILHHERTPGTEEVGDQYWQGYTYIWNDRQDEATLLEHPQGLDRAFTIQDADAPDGRRQQTWHFPGRAECVVCHNMAAKYALGVNTLQLNKDHDYGGVTDNQLRTLEHLGAFTGALPARPSQLPSLVDYRDSSQPLADRARAYLHANCSHCHRKWGGGNAEFQLLYSLDLSDMGIVDTRPGQGDFYLPDARLLAPGDPYRSVMYYRMAKLGSGRMPRIGSTEVDEFGLNLIHDWIMHLSPAGSDASAQQAVSDRRTDEQAALERIRRGEQPAADRFKDLDQLLASTSSALRLLRDVDEQRLPPAVVREVISRGSQNTQAHVRDLFERFLPESQRTQRLGSVIDPDEILVLPGDRERGRAIFFETAGVECKKCHRVGDVGGTVGPDLSEIGKKFNRAQLLETILQPSKEIDPKYVTYVAETKEGQVHAGILVQRSSDQVTLKDAEDKLIELRTEELERLAPQPTSLMPELLLRDLTARQVADLTEYLSSLK